MVEIVVSAKPDFSKHKPWNAEYETDITCEFGETIDYDSGWLTDCSGNYMVEYDGCGSHRAKWAPGALEHALMCINTHEHLVRALQNALIELITELKPQARQTEWLDKVILECELALGMVL